jgi:hypothetical protein
VNRPALARCLPEGVHLSDVTDPRGGPLQATVGMKLAELGAYADGNGHLREASGRRIEFFFHRVWAFEVPPPAGWEEERDRRLRDLSELKKTSAVIELWPQ